MYKKHIVGFNSDDEEHVVKPGRMVNFIGAGGVI